MGKVLMERQWNQEGAEVFRQGVSHKSQGGEEPDLGLVLFRADGFQIGFDG